MEWEYCENMRTDHLHFWMFKLLPCILQQFVIFTRYWIIKALQLWVIQQV